ncbi:NepR family anti-sigma factor [Sphingomonas sp. LM7]|uniref:NepR family anti-sigma factor n=1 Tax=Sphingomonas sp. LM7 TaxID=1938607 RepID=UPI00209A8095|nr:NepR family anti-sigma factor [Sphingomonas sp. LM7]
MRSAKDEKKGSPKSKGGTESSKPSRNLGDALRQAYDEAVRETVPDDLLDLLKKLD